MYKWRKLSDDDRNQVIKNRLLNKRPYHSPPHFSGDGFFHLTAANFEHVVFIGKSTDRIMKFENELLAVLNQQTELIAWCVLPNHYHLLINCDDLKQVTKTLGQLHGRTSKQWNDEDGTRGRQCWCRCSDRQIRDNRHFYATLNYIHHNPVKHNLVSKWGEWPFSSADKYIEKIGKDKALEVWKKYPILNYGDKWDTFDFEKGS